ncbi:HD family phosphohydrolase [Fuchsiella alkaliacetigena]|uniref:HD family phosphohydrolase n=1 Tax=Fuchsiella alkaliacetigena TaxID=957042 RepID=UPI00200B4399|nr:HDIG domain-containing metalloprotein [Fuchsiella alkaliacetigena]MCK8824459.1 HDIG domain-containing protein [Fuchsiella alkaliacetigena]
MGFLDEIKEKVANSEFNFQQDESVKRWIWIIVVFVVLTLILTIDFIPDQKSLQVGEPSPEEIVAPHTVEFIDEERTEERRAEAAEKIESVYIEDKEVRTEVEAKLSDFFKLIKLLNETFEVELKTEELPSLEELTELQLENEMEFKESLSLANKLDIVEENIDFYIPDKVIRYLLLADLETFEYVEEKTKEIINSYFEAGIKSDQLEEAQEELSQEVEDLPITSRYRYVIEELGNNLLQANLILDLEKTEELKAEAREEVEPVKEIIEQGQSIVSEGETVTQQKMDLLEELEIAREDELTFLIIIGLTLVVFIFITIFVIYLYQYQREVLADEGVVALLGILPILILLFAKIMTFFPIEKPAYLVPVAGLAMLLTVLTKYDLAIMVTLAISFLVGIVVNGGMVDVAVLLIGGLAGVYSVTKVSQRSDLVRAGFYVSGASALTILAFQLSIPPVDLVLTLKLVALGILNGVISAVVTNGLLPYLENTFGIVSPVKLLELSNPNQPLLKKLLVEAPGSYHHSIIVGNLAEAAADVVEADSLLVRVGAYYHDVGKIKRPYFFSENQLGPENPHSKLSPNLSTLIITSHVKDGVELARKYHLPKSVIDIIEQHHAKSLVSFFYEEALHDDKYDNVKKENFVYEGPKPQTKEAAIVMLADVVEATTRSRTEVHSNPDRIEALVREIIKGKLADGQLDESDLTLKDLDKIINSFVNILTGIFHNRVEYPDSLAEEMEGQEENGSNDQ